MRIFEQCIATYFLSSAALAGAAVLWRNWLEDHPGWKEWLHQRLGASVRALTCGSCFTYWITLGFVLILNPLAFSFIAIPPFTNLAWPILYLIQWMAIEWGALFFRFSYVLLQESVSILVHRFKEHRHARDSGSNIVQ